MSDVLDVPLTAEPEKVEQMLQDLMNGDSITLEVRPEDADQLIDQLDWQLEHGRPVTKLVADFTEANHE